MTIAESTTLVSQRDAAFLLVGIFLTAGFFVWSARKAAHREIAHPPDAIAARLKILENLVGVVITSFVKPEEFMVLLFGPGPPQPKESMNELNVQVWDVRTGLRAKLENLRFMVVFGEDIPEATKNNELLEPMTIDITEKAVASRAGSIVILASSIGSATELGMISQHKVLCEKTVIAIHQAQKGAYMLLGTAKAAERLGARVVHYTGAELATKTLTDTLALYVLEKFEAKLSRSMLVAPLGGF